MTIVFVYGTLRSGQGNHRRLARARFLGEAQTAPRYTLISIGCPGLLEGGETAVFGELYEVDSSTLASLDQLEGHPHFYERRPVDVPECPGAIAYFLPAEEYATEPRIESGDWVAWRGR